MSELNRKTTIEEKEITFKDLILKVQEYSREIIKNWKLIIFFIIPFVLYFLFKAYTTPSYYSAQLLFMLNEDEGGGGGGAMAILSQFGFGGGAGAGKFNIKKIMELSKTRKLIQLTLFDSATIDGKTDLLANHVIDIYGLHKKWEKSSLLKDFKFNEDNIQNLGRTENSVLKNLQSIFLGSRDVVGIYSTDVEEDTGIMTLKASSLSEQLSIDLLNTIFENLSEYYTNKSIEKQRYTYDIVKNKVDSINTALNAAEYSLAKFRDSNRGTWAQTSTVTADRLSRNLRILGIMYGEAIKNLEIADFSMKSKTPIVQLIDPPVAPLSENKKSIVVAIIYGILLGGLLSFGFIITRKWLRDTLGDKKE